MGGGKSVVNIKMVAIEMGGSGNDFGLNQKHFTVSQTHKVDVIF